VIDDPSLASVPIVGVFRTTDIEGFVAAAAAALNTRATIDGDLIRLKYASLPK
jgi:ferric-dicitrate binding protein FerR (iron transport regulator)